MHSPYYSLQLTSISSIQGSMGKSPYADPSIPHQTMARPSHLAIYTVICGFGWPLEYAAADIIACASLKEPELMTCMRIEFKVRCEESRHKQANVVMCIKLCVIRDNAVAHELGVWQCRHVFGICGICWCLDLVVMFS